MTGPIPSLAAAAAALGRGETTSTALTEACLARIEAQDTVLSAFVTLCAPEALRAADRADRARAEGRPCGPLQGIPIALKDIIETAGIRTTGQSGLFVDRVPERSATVWDRLEAAGAILLGKTTTWEFALGGTEQDLPFPPARNPWNPGHDTGGSSSGSAAAVAAGLCLGALGTDTAGSVRAPAGWCGCAGLKPTLGRVSRAGVYPLSHTLDHVGPIAWTVEDCGLLLDAISGRDPRDPHTPGVPEGRRPGAGASVAGLRIGRVPDISAALGTDDEVAGALSSAFDALAASSATIVDTGFPDLGRFDAVCNIVSRAEAFAFYRHWLAESPEKFGRETRARLMAGGTVPAADYIDALRVRTSLIEEMETLFTHVDLIVCEVSGSTAPPHGGATRYARLATRPFNVTGGPALSVPAGLDAAGLPIAVQVAGPPWADVRVMQAGRVIEAALGARDRRPAG